MDIGGNETNANSWMEFLQQRGAQYRAGRVDDFGRPDAERRAARDGHVLVDLSHLSLIQAAGADAKSFLNGQLTNDITQLDDAHTQLSAWCSAKGRMLAILRIIPHDEGYLLQLPEALRDEITKRLQMYVLRSKVTLVNADRGYVRIGFAGSDAAARLRRIVGAAPEGQNALVRYGSVVLLQLPGGSTRYEILCPPAEAPALWSDLARDAVPAGADAWSWHDIMAGIPTVLPQTSDAFVPQMANLDLVGGVSFSKGCYIGQEIVARVHYLGRLKQRMYRGYVDGAAPQPGTAIYASGGTQSSGTVVISAPAPETGSDLLAVIHTESAQSGELHLERPDGPPLRLESLPYRLDVTKTH